MAYTAEKTLRDLGDKVPADARHRRREQDPGAVREALNGNDAAEIRRRSEELSQALQQVGAAMYHSSRAAAGRRPRGRPAGRRRRPAATMSTVEGEFREV